MASGTIVIDPGHGGNTQIGGSSRNNATSTSGVPEKVITLQMAYLARQAIRDVAEAGNHDIRVFLTRESDKNLSLLDRAKIAQRRQADLFLSIHCNGFNGSARGTETWVLSEAHGNVNLAEDLAFAQRIQRGVVGALSARDSEARNRGVKQSRVRFGVLRDDRLGTNAQGDPCRACLLELEFIDVPAVDRLLNTGPNYLETRQEVAHAIGHAVVAELS